MSERRFRFEVTYARRMPDPIYGRVGGERHIMILNVEDVPEGVPKDPNPRNQRTDKGIYRDVQSSLLNEEGTANTFHLKNKGITAIAKGVEKIEDDVYEIEFPPDYGIVDGGHTYEIVSENRELILERNEGDTQIDQYVKFEILTGIPEELVPEIAGGLNTAVQVQEMSLAELRNEFEWIKDELGDQPYFEGISFKENEGGHTDARDLVVMLDVFNISEWPNDSDGHPVRAFQSKAKVLDAYLDSEKRPSYEKLRPILKDILVLHDTISIEARELHNKAGGKGGKLAFVESRKRGKYEFPFVGEESETRLTRGALLPMLGAFRWMVIEDENGEFTWKGSFEDVLDLWRETGAELMRATQSTSDDLSRQPNLIGKSRNHWATLHSTVAKRNLMAAAS